MRENEERGGMTARRWTVLKSVAATMAARGFEGVGMREIGTAAGLNPGTLYHHFRSKEDALLTICMIGHAQTFADLTAVLDESDAFRVRIETLFARHATALREVGDFIQVYSNHRLELSPDLARPLTDGWAAYRASLLRLFREAVANGEIAEGPDPTHLGRLLVGQLRIVNQLHRSGREDEIPAYINLASRLFLSAVTADIASDR